MPCLRASTRGGLHGRIAAAFRSLIEKGEPSGIRREVLSNLAYHTDMAARISGDGDALFDLLDAPWFVPAVRGLPDGTWRETLDLHRLAVSARDNDRVDQFALAVLKLEWARSSIGARFEGWRRMVEELDLPGIRGLALILKRPEQDQHRSVIDPGFWRTLLAVTALRLREIGAADEELLRLLEQSPASATALDLELPAVLLARGNIPLPEWASPSARRLRQTAMQPRDGVAGPIPRHVAIVRDALARGAPAAESSAVLEGWARELRYADVAMVLSSLDPAVLTPQGTEALRAFLDLLPGLPWTDDGRRDVVFGLRSGVMKALVESGWDPVAWTGTLLERVESEYFSCLSQAARHLAGVLGECGLWHPVFVTLARHAVRRNEFSARYRIGAIASFCLARHLEQTGETLSDEDLSWLAEVERSILPVAQRNFLELALARAAGRAGDLDAFERHFHAITNPWARGQAIIRQTDDVAGNPRLWPLLPRIQENPLACSLVIQRIASTLQDGKPAAERFRMLLSQIRGNGLDEHVRMHALGTLVRSAVASPDRGESLDVLGNWLPGALDATTTADWRKVLLASLEGGILPGEWPAPTEEMLRQTLASLAPEESADLAALPAATAWGIRTTDAPPPRDDLAPAWTMFVDAMDADEPRSEKLSLTPDELVAMTNAAMVADEEWLGRLVPRCARWLIARIVKATPTPCAFRVCLDLSPRVGLLAGEDPLRYALELGADPAIFAPIQCRQRSGPLWRIAFRWMHEHETRSDLLLRHVDDEDVRGFLLSCDQRVGESDAARAFSQLARPGRKALLWMGAQWFGRGSLARLIAGELVNRCGRSSEYVFLEEWLTAHKEGTG